MLARSLSRAARTLRTAASARAAASALAYRPPARTPSFLTAPVRLPPSSLTAPLRLFTSSTLTFHSADSGASNALKAVKVDTFRMQDSTVTSVLYRLPSGNSIIVDDSSFDQGSALLDTGIQFFNEGDYDKALEILTLAAEYIQRDHGENHSMLVGANAVMGCIRVRKNQPERAIVLLETSIKILRTNKVCKEEIGEKNTIRLFSMVALQFNQIGDAEKTKETLKHAIDLVDELGTKRDPEYIAEARSTAHVCFLVGHMREAKRLFTDVLTVQRTLLGENHVDTSATLNALGDCANALQDLEEAQRMYEAALRVRKEALGENSVDYGLTLGNLGSTLVELGKLDEGYKCLRDGLKVQMRELGEDHYALTVILKVMVSACNSLGMHKEALQHLEHALAIEKKHKGDDHPSLVEVYFYLALLYNSTMEADKSLAAAEKALQLHQAHVGEMTTATALGYAAVANAHYMKKDFEKALEMNKKATDILRKTEGQEGKDSKYLVNAYMYISNTYLNLGRMEEATEAYQKCEALKKKLGME